MGADQGLLDKCTSWEDGGGGFTESPEKCPQIESCRHPTFVDSKHPERMKSGTYCIDKSMGVEQASLDKCSSWTAGGGGFTPSTETCPGATSTTTTTAATTAGAVTTTTTTLAN